MRSVSKTLKRLAQSLVVVAAAMPAAYAVNFVRVADLSQLKYQTTGDGKIFLRNLNDFDSNALRMCSWVFNKTLEPTTMSE